MSTLSSIWSVLVGNNAVKVGSLLTGTTALDTEARLCRLGDRAAIGEGGGFGDDTVIPKWSE